MAPASCEGKSGTGEGGSCHGLTLEREVETRSREAFVHTATAGGAVVSGAGGGVAFVSDETSGAEGCGSIIASAGAEDTLRATRVQRHRQQRCGFGQIRVPTDGVRFASGSSSLVCGSIGMHGSAIGGRHARYGE